MKLAIMQPYFFPYMGYFQLMSHVDCWVVFDHCQFVNKGWVNRNRVLHPDPSKDWQFVTVPLSKRGRFDFIDDIQIEAGADWRRSLLGKLTHYRRAPYYDQARSIVESAINYQGGQLSSLLVHSLKVLADYLGLSTRFLLYSELNLGIDSVSHPGQWALRISEALGSKEYINPWGGRALFRPEEFAETGIDLSFIQPRLAPYDQQRPVFVPDLSIIDVMMWCNSRKITSMLREDYSILRLSGDTDE